MIVQPNLERKTRVKTSDNFGALKLRACTDSTPRRFWRTDEEIAGLVAKTAAEISSQMV
jgi:hypothetical protein